MGNCVILNNFQTPCDETRAYCTIKLVNVELSDRIGEANLSSALCGSIPHVDQKKGLIKQSTKTMFTVLFKRGIRQLNEHDSNEKEINNDISTLTNSYKASSFQRAEG
ncbi:hypothetical protein RCL_jg2619.t1 [Rhizophagus clarus]|uniref:Uncharacterized protein n=1 Tax=Rhizophagus clarus TaxID=94130 RepID=A0A8H3LGD8_9GLOM|nr:hypothetical protein RCL_jg2619.t1 [Rhizophagus clarus]